MSYYIYYTEQLDCSLFIDLYEGLFYPVTCLSELDHFLLLSPEMFLILSIFLYLCFVNNFNNFYISSLFFYFVLFFELLLLTYQSFLIFYINNFMPVFFFNSGFCCDFYSAFCKLSVILVLIFISILSEFKFV